LTHVDRLTAVHYKSGDMAGTPTNLTVNQQVRIRTSSTVK
jgi:hypothetical protein